MITQNSGFHYFSHFGFSSSVTCTCTVVYVVYLSLFMSCPDLFEGIILIDDLHSKLLFVHLNKPV